MAIVNGLVTLDQFKQFTAIKDALTADRTAMIEDAITTASSEVELHTGRQFHKAASGDPTPRYCDSLDGRTIEFADCYDVDEIAVDQGDDGTYTLVLTAGQYELLPVGGIDDLLGASPYTGAYANAWNLFPYPRTYWRRKKPIKVTGSWGWSAVPMQVQRATLTLAQDIVRDPEARFGGLTISDGAVLGRVTNPRVAQLLAPFVRPTRTLGLA